MLAVQEVESQHGDILLEIGDRCWIHITNGGKHTTTGMKNDAGDWRSVHAEVPANDDSYLTRARKLGYPGNDQESQEQMCREHEAIHTLMSVKRGLPFSPTLFSVAFPDESVSMEEQYEEERYVLAIQRYMNEGKDAEEEHIQSLREQFDVDEFVSELKSLLR